jgi:acetoin utilization deacetylase AcuC-like enzyme
VAVTAAALVARGERVAIVDWDVHHGNGTQEIFWDDPRVLFVSVHERGLFPGTGRGTEVGGPSARGGTLNIPLPSGTAGDALRLAFDELVEPTVSAFAPTWVLVSAGFDGHRADPIGGWALTAGDYGDLAARVSSWVPEPGRLVAFLEGGYDLVALGASVGSVGAAFLGEPYRAEAPSSGTTGMDEVAAMRDSWRRQAAAQVAVRP